MSKQTAVEWFASRISHGGLVSMKQFNELLEQAKAMEKEIIRTAYLDGMDGEYNTSEQYYNETFKSE